MGYKPFIGRKVELAELNRIDKHKRATLIVCLGRRRIGKSRLVQEFGKSFHSYVEIQGLAPRDGQTNGDQLENFSREISRQTGLPLVGLKDWIDGFQLLANHVKGKRVLIFLDEISWMGSHDPDFLGKLKIAWDQYFSKNPGTRLILCGSVSSWIQKNILNSTLFVGRISLTLPIRDLLLPEAVLFFEKKLKYLSDLDVLRILSLTGGVPRYLEELDLSKTVEENYRDLCFKKSGFLVSEFDRIFEDIFGRRSSVYQKIVYSLIQGPKTQSEISSNGNLPINRVFSEYLKDLELAGFIRKETGWDLKTGKDTPHINRYRLVDCYVRFYFKFIAPNRSRIEKELLASMLLEKMPEFDIFTGYQFETLITNNLPLILQHLEINPASVVNYGPFIQRATQRKPGCQIDLLIQTKNNLFVCELKARRKINSDVMQSMKEKIIRLNYPKWYSIRPVLIHTGKIEPEILEEDYFDKTLSLHTLVGIKN